MKRLLSFIFLSLSVIVIPAAVTFVFRQDMGSASRTMGIEVVCENGEQIDGEEYVMGMAASELSYVEEKEALKAWMIVCRTNLIKAAGKKKKVKEKTLSLDYISPEEMEKRNGKKALLEYKRRLEEVSEETFGQVLVYKNQLIDGLYHQVSSGETVSAKEMYHVDVPYLVSVDSPQDVESEEYLDIRNLTWEECAKILARGGKKESGKSCKKYLAVTDQTEEGCVKKISTKKNEWTGEEWRKLFDLSSTCFYLESYGDHLRIIALGKGHGMGMSLYGANVMARDKDADRILTWYYPGAGIADMAAYLP